MGYRAIVSFTGATTYRVQLAAWLKVGGFWGQEHPFSNFVFEGTGWDANCMSLANGTNANDCINAHILSSGGGCSVVFV